MNLKVKLCGLKNKESIIASKEADYIGFVFYQKSPRFINALDAKDLIEFIRPKQKVVGLFVDADLNLINHITDFLKLDVIQLHGNEKLSYIKEVKKLKKPIIKAVPIKNFSDINYSKKYKDLCDMILFDTKSNHGVSGGSGISFDWNLLRGYYSEKKWILAGGLNVKNVSEALEITNAPIVDISSGIEKARGEKCKNMIKNFMEFIANYEKTKDKL